MKKQQIFILYSHALFARGVERMLKGRRGLQIVGMEANWARGIETIASLHPEVVIVDSDNGGMGSLAMAKEIMERSPCTKVIALTLNDNKMHLYDARESPATGVEDLLRAIREGNRGKRRSER
ncbi:MAG: hypothetical protein Q8P22_01675 [Chloroflexota bacterium]|nr:hypothetical protein [Chloroflexota bacterium]